MTLTQALKLTIGLFPVSNPKNDDHKLGVGDRIDHPIGADPQSIAIVIPGEFRRLSAPRIMGKHPDGSDEAEPVSLLPDGLDFLPCGGLDPDVITCHGA